MQHDFYVLNSGKLEQISCKVVQEFPLQLVVNGRELAMLISSPHELRFLAAGFLRLQGFIKTAEDIIMLGVCEKSGAASIKIKGDLPGLLKPILTSGCGTGITFSLPGLSDTEPKVTDCAKVKSDHIFSLMEKLAGKAEKYRSSGGIHSAAAGYNGELLLYAEDLGRHNTLDRLAGESLLRGIELNGAILVTSGRVSAEMVAKCILMGVKVIASRTSPTDMAVDLCSKRGICLVGYVKKDKFKVYSHPEILDCSMAGCKISGITGVILAGGSSRRMGSNKALLQINGKTMIEKVYEIMSSLFDDVMVITNSPDEYSFLPCRKIPDIYPGYGCIAGLHSALTATGTDRIFITGCDMPFLNPELIKLLCNTSPEADAVVPVNMEGLLEPLHAVYAKSSLVTVSEMIAAGEKSILRLFERVRTTEIAPSEYAHIDQAEASFSNVNTPGEFQIACS